jgi:RimJ/RimL family protein N-acetyltransferase
MLVTSGDLHPAKIATIDVDLGVRLDWQGRGLGRSLLAAAQEWAVSQGVHRLQLRVMTHNAPAISLYKSFGFEIEGTLRDHLKIKGRFVDQFVMAKLLG